MKLIKGTVYEQWPPLLFTPYAMFDIGTAALWNSYVDAYFAVMQHALAPTTPMGDLPPHEGKQVSKGD